jgi:flagellar protein FlgJ
MHWYGHSSSFILHPSFMSPKDFVEKFLPFAKQAQRSTGIHAVAILAQAALETGWGKSVPGNMFFGIKDPKKGKTGKGQLLRTVEYLRTPDQRHLFPEVISVTWDDKRKRWKYVVRDWFKKYDTPAGSFRDHGRLISKNPRYATAMLHRKDPVRFLQEVAKAGYATAPDYATVLVRLVNMIQALIPESAAQPARRDVVAPPSEPDTEAASWLPSEEELWAYLPDRSLH